MNEGQPFPDRETHSSMAGRRISLNIERLVVEGVSISAGQATRLRHAMQHELTRLLRSDRSGHAAMGGAVPWLVAPTIVMSQPFHPARLGRQIARSVYGSLTGTL
jgi:hypothetical protein